MNDSNTLQKKKIIYNIVYATLIAVLVIACATTIALVSSSKKPSLNVGENNIQVSNNTYVVPMKNATIQKDYSGSELQFNDTLKQWEIHKGIDFLAGEDSSVFAVANGTVSNVYTNYLEGTVIEITHDNGIVSVYKSLAKDVNVAIGDKVSAGQTIGVASNSMAQELNNGAHLHFEMMKNGKKINPNDYLSLGNK